MLELDLTDAGQGKPPIFHFIVVCVLWIESRKMKNCWRWIGIGKLTLDINELEWDMEFYFQGNRFIFIFAMIFLLLCLLMLWLVFLPQTECKMHPILCNRVDALQIPHEYYQPGNFVIGGISSQFVSFFKALSFQEHPRSMFIEDPM